MVGFGGGGGSSRCSIFHPRGWCWVEWVNVAYSILVVGVGGGGGGVDVAYSILVVGVGWSGSM